jgi:starvation-inducible DNA-binding protein
VVVEIINNLKTLLTQMKIISWHGEVAGDEGAKNMLGSYIGQLEKASWMLNTWTN